jgi:tRNA-2-methylthio-N6-dimethylallyladenosine synthase
MWRASRPIIAITKGCNNMCTFCIVPFTRGREVSRESDNILREARNLVEKGAKEIWLLGQNVNSYRAAADYRFYELLDEMSQMEGWSASALPRRIPKDWNNALSDLMASRKRICNQLHLPFQAGSDRLLHDDAPQPHAGRIPSRRSSTCSERVPTVELSTDLIVGFPSETEEDFERTLLLPARGALRAGVSRSSTPRARHTGRGMDRTMFPAR